jgi:O-antigen/teichoic acid export membrane protein
LSQTRLAARATIVSWLGAAAQYAATLVSTPIMIHGLGIVNYGLWSLVFDVLGSPLAMDIGLGGSATKHLAELEAKKDWQRYVNCIAIARQATRWQTLTLFLIGLMLALSFPYVFNTADTPKATVWLVAVLTSLGTCIAMYGNTNRCILRSKNRHDILNFTANLRTLCMQVTGAALIYYGGSLQQLALLSLFMTVALQLSLYYFAERNLVIPEGYHAQPDEDLKKRMFRFGGSLVFGQVAKLISSRSGRLVIGVMLGTQMVAFYEVAQQFTTRVLRLGTTLTPGVMPLAARMQAKDDQVGLQRLGVISIRLLLMFGICAATMLISQGGAFIHFWLDEAGSNRFEANTYPVLVMLAIAVAIELPNVASTFLLTGMGAIQPVRNYAILEGILTLLLCSFLGWSHGILGVGIGMLASQVVVGIFLRPRMLARKMEIPFPHFLRVVVLRAIISCLPCIAFAIGFYYLLPPTSLWMVIGEVALLAVLGMVPAVMIGLDAEIRRQLFMPVLKRIRGVFAG